MTLRQLLLSVCALTLVVACDKDKKPTTPENKDLVSYDLKIKINPALTPSKELTDLARKISLGQQVSFNRITDLIISDHTKEYNRLEHRNIPTSEVHARIKELVDSIKSNNSMPSQKVVYEKKIEDRLSQRLIYNKAKVTIVHPLLDARVQYYSGSMLNTIIQRKKYSGKDFRNQNYVMIYERGHQFPGQMIRKNNKWHLMGVETTAKGIALVELGEASSLAKRYRVFDADYAAVIEVFKFYLNYNSKKPRILARTVREMTAKKYGIKLPKQAKKLGAGPKHRQGFANFGGPGKGATLSGRTLNQSPMAFGNSNVADGDQERSEYSGIGSSSVVRSSISPIAPGPVRNRNWSEVPEIHPEARQHKGDFASKIKLLLDEKAPIICSNRGYDEQAYAVRMNGPMIQFYPCDSSRSNRNICQFRKASPSFLLHRNNLKKMGWLDVESGQKRKHMVGTGIHVWSRDPIDFAFIESTPADYGPEGMPRLFSLEFSETHSDSSFEVSAWKAIIKFKVWTRTESSFDCYIDATIN